MLDHCSHDTSAWVMITFSAIVSFNSLTRAATLLFAANRLALPLSFLNPASA
jgi:hypothetical protein